MAILVIKLDVNVDPTLVDPHDVVEDILGAYGIMNHEGEYEVSQNFLEAEWED